MVYWRTRKGLSWLPAWTGHLLVSSPGARTALVPGGARPGGQRFPHKPGASLPGASEVQLESWTAESEFWPIRIRSSTPTRGRRCHRNICPDGFFILSAGKHRIRYLLEIDRSTEDNPRFLREKILPGLAYVNSQAYADRFGHRSGRWLVSPLVSAAWPICSARPREVRRRVISISPPSAGSIQRRSCKRQSGGELTEMTLCPCSS